MIDHGRALTLAATAIDFPLVNADRRTLDDHLSACGACRVDAAAYGSDAGRLAALPPIDPPSRVRATVLKRRSSPRIWLLAAAALVVVLTLGTIAIGAVLIDLQRQDLPPVPLPTSGPSVSPAVVPSAAPSESLPAPVAAQVGAVWNRVSDPDLVPEPRDSAGMGGVIAGGPGAIAWSWVYWEGPQIFTTVDGTDWTPARVEAVDGAAADLPGWVVDVAPGGPGYVAVGEYEPAGGGRRAGVWTSVDGRTWRRAPDVAAFDAATMGSVLPWRGEMLAFGHESTGVSLDAVAWASPDGLAWDRVGLSLPNGLTRLAQPVASADRLWALGMGDKVAVDDPSALARILVTSTDGRTWVPADAPWIGPLHVIDGALYAIVQPEPTPLPGAAIPGITEPPAPAGPAPGVYRLTGSGAWELLPGGPAGFAHDLTSVGSTMVLVGAASSPCGQDCQASGWRSRDGGATWVAVPSDDVGSLMTSAAALPDGTIVAVGVASIDPATTTTAAWVSPPARP